jgi:hypothetical protein
MVNIFALIITGHNNSVTYISFPCVILPAVSFVIYQTAAFGDDLLVILL